MSGDCERVLSFWLDEVGPEGWWKPDPDLDRLIRSRFVDLWDDAVADALWHWMHHPRGSLALIVLVDQFPRNMFRGHAAAFQSDPLARRAAKYALDRGHDLAVDEPGRQFFYLPLEHSESLQDQNRAARLMMTRLPAISPEGVDACLRHREVIRRFGRFPSRNAALGRPDTLAELAYRAEGGYMSGAPGSGPG